MNSQQEQRGALRVHLQGKVLIRAAEQQFEARVELQDISLKGVFVQTPHRLPLGAQCSIDLEIAGPSSSMQTTLAGVVQRHEEDGMAIAFPSLDAGSRLHLSSLIGRPPGQSS